jgi:hypothetical protein
VDCTAAHVESGVWAWRRRPRRVKARSGVIVVVFGVLMFVTTDERNGRGRVDDGHGGEQRRGDAPPHPQGHSGPSQTGGQTRGRCPPPGGGRSGTRGGWRRRQSEDGCGLAREKEHHPEEGQTPAAAPLTALVRAVFIGPLERAGNDDGGIGGATRGDGCESDGSGRGSSEGSTGPGFPSFTLPDVTAMEEAGGRASADGDDASIWNCKWQGE